MIFDRKPATAPTTPARTAQQLFTATVIDHLLSFGAAPFLPHPVLRLIARNKGARHLSRRDKEGHVPVPARAENAAQLISNWRLKGTSAPYRSRSIGVVSQLSAAGLGRSAGIEESP
jgi:hypothetical protein